MQAIPLPPAFPIPQAFVVPDPILAPPQIKPLEWEPIPMYIEAAPQNPPIPQPTPNLQEDGLAADTEESEENQEREEQQSLQNKSEEKQNATPALGKPPIDLVPEIAEIQTVELPIIGVEIPLPRTEILVTAGTTAGVSSVVAVSGTLFATTLFRQLQPILKPIFKTILKKLAKIRKKPAPRTWARERLLQKRLKVAASHPGK